MKWENHKLSKKMWIRLNNSGRKNNGVILIFPSSTRSSTK